MRCRKLEEAGYWLELLVESGTITERELDGLDSETNELIAIFVAIVKSAKDHR